MWHGPPTLADWARESIASSCSDPPWHVGSPLQPSEGQRDDLSNFRKAAKVTWHDPTCMIDRARESIPDSRGDPPRDFDSFIYKTSSKAGTAPNIYVSGMCDEKKFSRRMQSLRFAHHLRTPSFSSLAGPGRIVDRMDLQCLRLMMRSKKQQKEKPMERLCSDYSHRE